MENIEKKDIVRKCSRCGIELDKKYEFKCCEECRKFYRERERRKVKRKKEKKEREKPIDLFDFSTFNEEEQRFLKTRLEKYINSEEYDLEDPVVEYQLYSILIEELDARKLRLKMLEKDIKAHDRAKYERQIDNAHKRLRDLWGDLNALIRQKLPDGSKKVSIAEQIKELEEKKKEIREQSPEKEKMKKVLKKRIEEEDI